MSKTNAVIVLYNPTDEQVTRVKKQSINFDRCYIVDNSEAISNELSEFDRCVYLPLMNNLGIAEAQNIALAKIIEDEDSLDEDLVYFFDQDSIYNEDLIVSLKFHFMKLFSEDENNRVVGPCYVVEDDVQNIGEAEYIKKLSIISSGTVTNVMTIKECGLFMSELFIDCVDHEWCWRVNKMGFKINQINKLNMLHKIGDGALLFLGCKFYICNRVRCYYQFRNWTYLISRNKVPSKILFKSIILLLLRFVAYLFNNDGVDKSRYCLLGFKDGLLGCLGKRQFK